MCPKSCSNNINNSSFHPRAGPSLSASLGNVLLLGLLHLARHLELLKSLTQQPLHNPAEGPFKSPLKRYRSPKWQGFESPTPEVLVNGSEERSHDALAPPPGSQLTAYLGSVDAFIPDVEESGTIMWVIMP